MVIHSHCKDLLCLLLTYDIGIKEILYLLGLGEIDITYVIFIGIVIRKFLFQYLSTELHALVTDIGIVGACYQLSDLSL